MATRVQQRRDACTYRPHRPPSSSAAMPPSLEPPCRQWELLLEPGRQFGFTSGVREIIVRSLGWGTPEE